MNEAAGATHSTLRNILHLSQHAGTDGEKEAAKHKAEVVAKKLGVDLTKFDSNPVNNQYHETLKNHGYKQAFLNNNRYIHPHTKNVVDLRNNGWVHHDSSTREQTHGKDISHLNDVINSNR